MGVTRLLLVVCTGGLCLVLVVVSLMVLCVCGGRLYISLISFFCVLISGCMYCALCLVVPHILIEPIRCGYACV